MGWGKKEERRNGGLFCETSSGSLRSETSSGSLRKLPSFENIFFLPDFSFQLWLSASQIVSPRRLTNFTSEHIITARHPKDDGRLYFQSVHISGGGVPGPRSQIFGGVPGLRFLGGGAPGLRFSGGSQVSDFWGVPGLRFSGGGGSQASDFRGEGVPGLRFLGGGGPRSQIFLGGSQ